MTCGVEETKLSESMTVITEPQILVNPAPQAAFTTPTAPRLTSSATDPILVDEEPVSYDAILPVAAPSTTLTITPTMTSPLVAPKDTDANK